MKTLIFIVVFLVIFALLIDVEISFNPLKIKGKWMYGVGILLISVGIGFISYSAKKDGQRQVLDVLTEIINEKQL